VGYNSVADSMGLSLFV